MLALGGANAVGVVLFGTLYAVAGAQLVSQTAFLACLALLFGLVTVLWVRTERRHERLDPLARIGRAAAGLVAVLIVMPVVVLMPLFWLDTQIPPEAGLNPMLAPVMTLVLIALVLVGLTNVVGGVAVAILALGRRFRARS